MPDLQGEHVGCGWKSHCSELEQWFVQTDLGESLQIEDPKNFGLQHLVYVVMMAGLAEHLLTAGGQSDV